MQQVACVQQVMHAWSMVCVLEGQACDPMSALAHPCVCARSYACTSGHARPIVHGPGGEHGLGSARPRGRVALGVCNTRLSWVRGAGHMRLMEHARFLAHV